MKKLVKYLSPFAPDQSGACGVLYELGGLMVVCDAGGCAGNICGFDEPRWFTKRSAVFSAGLRDMDAILGRDDKLIKKLTVANSQLDCKFTALIGTPVPAVIATDFAALKKLAEKKTGLPCITVECTGTHYYDEGERKAWLALFSEFAREDFDTVPGRVGIIGATPLETSMMTNERIVSKCRAMGIDEPVVYGMGSALEDVVRVSSCERNLAVSAAAIPACEYLKERFGTPYEAAFPFLPENFKEKLSKAEGRALIIHSQLIANEIRKLLPEGQADCASFFTMDKSLAREGDTELRSEEQLLDLLQSSRYRTLIADGELRKLFRPASFEGRFIQLDHFAVSGRLWDTEE
ncbi:MAG: hypothetical protein IJ561_03055 [Ruminococcus sp.]|nr:hypothetical protein [Ruminococcus sp.]